MTPKPSQKRATVKYEAKRIIQSDPRPKCLNCPEHFTPANTRQKYCSDRCRKERNQYGGLTRDSIEMFARKVMKERARAFEERLSRSIKTKLARQTRNSRQAREAMRILAMAGLLPPQFLKGPKDD